MQPEVDQQNCQATVTSASQIVEALLHGLDRAQQAEATRQAASEQAAATKAQGEASTAGEAR